MKPRLHHPVIALSCLALLSPVKVQVDLTNGGGFAIAKATVGAKEGNNGGGNGNGGGKGNGGGSGNGNSGGKGNSGNAGNNGNSGNNGNAGSSGNAGGKGASGNTGSNGNSGNNGNGKGNGNAGGADKGSGGSGGNANAGQGNSNGRGNSSSQGNASNPGQSSRQGKTSGKNNGSKQKGGSLSGTGQPASTFTGGLSALFGTISDSLRPRAATPVKSVEKTKTRKTTAKTRSTTNASRSKQARSPRAGEAQAAADRGKTARASPRAIAEDTAAPARLTMSASAADRDLPKPARSERSIVAVGVTPGDMARLSAQGFRAEAQTKGTLASVVRLVPPRGMSLGEAQRRVRVVDTDASADFDHYYYTDEGSACTGPSCEAISLVGWSGSTSEQCGPAPTIGLIDTGIDRDHEALKGQSIEVLSGPDLRGSPSKPDHGTAMAAILVGRSDSNTPGLIPGARLLAIDAFYRNRGTADRTDVVTLVRALETLAEKNVRVVNMSLSGSPNEVLKRAITAAQAKGMIIVAAAGNNGAGGEPSYPAAYPGVIAVTAVDRNLAIYSRATQGEYVDMAAPGVDLWVASAGGGGTVKSGTSYAVPFISAAAAILSTASHGSDAADLQTTLESNTLDLGAPGRDRTYGQGLLQATRLCAPDQGETPIAHSTTLRGSEIP